MKKRTILLSLLAFAAFTSCQKSDEERGQVTPEKSPTKITMKLGEHDLSKSVGTPISPATSVVVGTLFSVEDFNGATLQGVKDVEFTKVGENYTAVPDINSSSTRIKLTGNSDGTLVSGVLLGSDVNTRQGDITKPVVLVSGEGEISGSPQTVAVTVAPEMARIEILPETNTGVGASATVKNVFIEVFMLNNTKIERDGQVIRTPAADFKLDYAPEGQKHKLCDFKPTTRSKNQASDYTRSSPPIFPELTPWSIISENGSSMPDPLSAKAVGYNIFPQPGGIITETAKASHPHIIIGITYDEKIGVDWVLAKEGFLNILALKTTTTASGYVENFEAGIVYTLTLGSIIDLIKKIPETPITILPDPDREGVSITCTVSKWGITEVTPEV